MCNIGNQEKVDINYYRIRSLSRRINDLEEDGYRFSREPRRDERGQRYTRYHYLGRKAA